MVYQKSSLGLFSDLLSKVHEMWKSGAMDDEKLYELCASRECRKIRKELELDENYYDMRYRLWCPDERAIRFLFVLDLPEGAEALEGGMDYDQDGEPFRERPYVVPMYMCLSFSPDGEFWRVEFGCHFKLEDKELSLVRLSDITPGFCDGDDFARYWCSVGDRDYYFSDMSRDGSFCDLDAKYLRAVIRYFYDRRRAQVNSK